MLVRLLSGCLLALPLLLAGCDAKASAKASHILVKEKQKCEQIKKQLHHDGADFAEMAKKHSTCPSGKRGGDLDTFGPGQMVKEFNDVVFNEPTNEVHGCVRTQFGYHLILVKERTE